MNIRNIKKIKNKIISIGRLLWEKDLVGGWNGNISSRVNDKCILLTGRGTCLGYLKEEDIVLLDLNGVVLDGVEASSEKLLHLDVYKNFSDIQAVVHTHTVFTNAFFLEHEFFIPSTFEGEYVLGKVFSVEQNSVNVKDSAPVVERLRTNKVVVLKRHGVVSIGKDPFDCFARIQVLEEQLKVEAMRALFSIRKVD
ncbi:MAG: class II aldolase/adducin family protein [Candidatus Omnitrophica bacterium]|nr:class II aldolase/adducin family protein [Candidatus Omnitrophota bacterium]